MSNWQPASVIKNDKSFAILVKIDEDEYVVPPQAWLQSGSDNQIYLSFSGDAPMRAIPFTAPTTSLFEVKSVV